MADHETFVRPAHMPPPRKRRAPRPYGPITFQQHLERVKFALQCRWDRIRRAEENLRTGQEYLAEYRSSPELNPGCSLQQWGESMVEDSQEYLAVLRPRPLATLRKVELSLG